MRTEISVSVIAHRNRFGALNVICVFVSIWFVDENRLTLANDDDLREMKFVNLRGAERR